MFNNSHLLKTLFGVMAVLAIIAIAGCAAKKNPWGDPDAGLILQYRMEENQELKYQTVTDFTMGMEIMGQPIEIKALETMNFSAKTKGLTGDTYRLGMTIDAMTMDISGTQGDMKPDMGSVVGKNFDMTLSILGEEGDLAGAEAIEYEIGPGQTYSMSAKFQAAFPDLPDKPVKIGDTWPSQETITEKTSKETINIRLSSVNTLEGFETINGRACARIKADVTGTLDGTGKQGAMDLIFNGNIKGADVWYFDYKEGVFVQGESSGSADGAITGSGPQEIIIPMTRVFTMEAQLVD